MYVFRDQFMMGPMVQFCQETRHEVVLFQNILTNLYSAGFILKFASIIRLNSKISNIYI